MYLFFLITFAISIINLIIKKSTFKMLFKNGMSTLAHKQMIFKIIKEILNIFMNHFKDYEDYIIIMVLIHLHNKNLYRRMKTNLHLDIFKLLNHKEKKEMD